MLGDQDKRVRKIAVQKIIDIRKEPLPSDGGPVVITKTMSTNKFSRKCLL